MVFCKEKPDMLPPLDAIGLVPNDQSSLAMQRGGSGHHRQASGPAASSSRSGSIGLGLGPPLSGFPKSTGLNPFAGGGMDNFSTTGAKLTSEERLQLARSRSNFQPVDQTQRVHGLLNKLTMKKFDSISDQIIKWVNKSEKENNGRTLIQVVRLVVEKATDEAASSEMYARLCRKMMEQISNKVQDDGIKKPEGKPIAGGQLFTKYLLNRCQEDFKRGWFAKEATAAAVAMKAVEDEAVEAANDKQGEAGEVALYSDEYYQKAKRQGLGLIKFIGELFKVQMITERNMHECVQKLLGNVNQPEEEEIESLCILLTTVGQILDTRKAHAHMDAYFQRMRELTKTLNVSPRMQFMLQVCLTVVFFFRRKWLTSLD
jgi:translation initiation factor 4G